MAGGWTSGRPGSDSDRDRGQTSLDFLIGVGVFLATIGFVALFATDAVTPYADDQSGSLVADRAADDLVGITLTEPGEANVLDETCTLAFFGVPGFSDAGCQFDSGDPLTGRVGISDLWDLNVTVERNDPATGQEIMCVDDASGSLQSCTGGGGETALAVGDRPDFGSGAVVTTLRVATFDGRDVAVVVRLW